jgi:uncharacterized protein (DUF4415 family)
MPATNARRLRNRRSGTVQDSYRPERPLFQRPTRVCEAAHWCRPPTKSVPSRSWSAHAHRKNIAEHFRAPIVYGVTVKEENMSSTKNSSSKTRASLTIAADIVSAYRRIRGLGSARDGGATITTENLHDGPQCGASEGSEGLGRRARIVNCGIRSLRRR